MKIGVFFEEAKWYLIDCNLLIIKLYNLTDIYY